MNAMHPKQSIRKPRRKHGTAPDPLPNALAYTINDAARISGLGRTTIYAEVNRGNLKLVKVAGRSLINGDSLRALVSGEPVTPEPAVSDNGKLLTKSEVAHWLRCSLKQIERLEKQPDPIPWVRALRQKRYPQTLVRGWLARRGAGTPDTTAATLDGDDAESGGNAGLPGD